MVNSAQRELLSVGPEWSIPQIMSALSDALNGVAPALAFGPVSKNIVPADCAVVIPTSGSTGRPKEVAFSAAALFASAQASNNRIGASTGDQWSLLLPIEHIAGVNVLVRSLELGTTPLDHRKSGQYVPAEYISVVPTQVHRALAEDFQLLDHLRTAKAVLVGGAASPAQLIERAQAAGVNVITTYGMSEMCGGCIYDGLPLDGVSVAINDQGLIELKGEMLANGYLNDQLAWELVCRDGWFLTSDLGELVDGKLKVLGRNDDQIISGGKKISLSVIEGRAQALFPGQSFVAFAIPDTEWGEKLILISDHNFDIEVIKSELRAHLGSFAIPKEFHILSEIPLKGIGKPDRERLRTIYSEKGST